MFAQADLNLNITNNVNYPVQINILGNPYNLLDTSNAKTEYRWDLTGFTFAGESQLSIQYKINGGSSFNIFSGNFTPQTLQSVVNVLNNLGIGFFSLYNVGANTYIGTYNDNFTFGDLNIYDDTISELFYTINQANAGGSGTITTIFSTTLYTTPASIPITQIPGNISGTIVSFFGTTEAGPVTNVIVTETNFQTLVTTTIFSTTYPALTPFISSFTAQAGYKYLITITE